MLQRSLFRALLLFAALLFAPCAVRADAAANAKNAILANYRRGDASLNKKNVDAVFAMQTADFTYTLKSGEQITREQEHQMIRQLTFAQNISAHTVVLKFSYSNGAAHVRAKEHIVATIADPQTQKQTRVVVDAVTEDTWVKVGGKWLVKRSKEISRSQNMTTK